MKQHILPKQALEITEEQFYSLFEEKKVKRSDWVNFHHKKMTIGQMIEYLGVPKISKLTTYGGKWGVIIFHTLFESDELCDALWKAVKYKVGKEV